MAGAPGILAEYVSKLVACGLIKPAISKATLQKPQFLRDLLKNAL